MLNNQFSLDGIIKKVLNEKLFNLTLYVPNYQL